MIHLEKLRAAGLIANTLLEFNEVASCYIHAGIAPPRVNVTILSAGPSPELRTLLGEVTTGDDGLRARCGYATVTGVTVRIDRWFRAVNEVEAWVPAWPEEEA